MLISGVILHASKTAMKTFPAKHEGQLFGRPPSLYLDPDRKVSDLLHLVMRTVSLLYWHIAQKHHTSKMHIDELRVFMKYSLKVSCSSLKRVKNNQDSVQISATGRSQSSGRSARTSFASGLRGSTGFLRTSWKASSRRNTLTPRQPGRPSRGYGIS